MHDLTFLRIFLPIAALAACQLDPANLGTPDSDSETTASSTSTTDTAAKPLALLSSKASSVGRPVPLVSIERSSRASRTVPGAAGSNSTCPSSWAK